MKLLIKLKKLAIVALFILLYSCANITEEIYLNADGSGEYIVYTDVISSTRSMMLGMMGSLYPDASADSLRQIVDAQIWEQFPAEVDSIMDFSSRIPDSIRNDPDQMKYVEKMVMFMKGSRKDGYLNSGMRFDFSSVEELQNFNDFMSQNQTGASNGMGMELPNMKVKYAFDGSTFSRTAVIEDLIEMSDSTLMMMGELLKGSKSRLKLHLPKKVKNASKGQLVGIVGKDVTYEFDLIKVVSGDQSSDIKVKF
ncbi:hypothetical protein [Ekhidna sp.]|uniref:hypothetical protein n=1 Tax=Ekhidna sp. TaxID=2608089 RepID=UPI003BABE4EA